MGNIVRDHLSQHREGYLERLRWQYPDLKDTGVLEDAIQDLLDQPPEPRYTSDRLGGYIWNSLDWKVKDVLKSPAWKNSQPIEKAEPIFEERSRYSWYMVEVRLDIERLMNLVSPREKDCMIAHYFKKYIDKYYDGDFLQQTMEKWNIKRKDRVKEIANEAKGKIKEILKKSSEIEK